VPVKVTNCSGDGAVEVTDTEGRADAPGWEEDGADVHPAKMTKNTTSTTGTMMIRFILNYLVISIKKIFI
jgi:hypothetical protein